MQSQFSLARIASLALVAGALSIAACSSSTTGPATAGNDSGVGGDGSSTDDGSTAADSGTDGGTDSASQMDTGGGNKPFGDPCTTNSNCASNVCFTGGISSYCSLHCTGATAATDCPNPPTSGMCNGMGFCKK